MSSPSWFDCRCSSVVAGRLGRGPRVADAVVERVGAVDLGLALAEQVQVRSRQQQDRAPCAPSCARRCRRTANAYRSACSGGSSTRSMPSGPGQHERQAAARLLVAAHEREQRPPGRALAAGHLGHQAERRRAPPGSGRRRRDPPARTRRRAHRRTPARSRRPRRGSGRSRRRSRARARTCGRG